MRAIQTLAPGGWDKTQIAEMAEPVPGPGQCLVELHAISLNPADYFQIEGSYPGGPRPPFVDGRDGSGTVVVADKAGKWPVGSKVVVLQTTEQNLAEGTFAERQRFSAQSLARLPEGWSFEEGAAAPLVFQTAWRALVVQGHLKKGQAVLVTGASGGVGSAAVQLAHGIGATVVALSRSEAKRSRLCRIGADHAFDPSDPDLKNKVFAAIGKKGVDLAIENVGGPSLKQSVHLLGNKGKVCIVGLLAGIDGLVPIPSLMFKQCSIEGVVVSAYAPEEAQQAWAAITECLARTNARPVIEATYPMDEFRAAFDRLRQSPFGKVVLRTPVGEASAKTAAGR